MIMQAAGFRRKRAGRGERVQGQPMPAYAAVSGPECTPGSPPGGPRGTGPIL